VIILTGGTGFIGSAMLWQLNQRGIRDILIVDRFDKGSKWLNLRKRLYNDVIDPEYFLSHIQDFFTQNSINLCIHLGAISDTTETDVDKLFHNNVHFSQALCLACEKAKVPFIYASSAATYGLGEQGFTTTPSNLEQLRPINPYGYSKFVFDIWINQQKLSIPWYGFKFFNVYGPQEYHKGSQASVAFHAFNQITKTDTLKLFKSYRDDIAHGEQKRDFVYIKDVVSILEHVIQNTHALPSGIYNLGTGKARSFLNLAEAMFAAMQKQINIDWIAMPEELKNQYQYFTEAPMEEAFAKLNYHKPMHTLENGVADYIHKYLATADPFL
jgi:ADP-L-glycero-D-manno-heptose 6-epimerase